MAAFFRRLCLLSMLLGTVFAEEDVDRSALTEQEILLHFFDATGGFRWSDRTSWLQGDGDAAVCSYFGVTCHVDETRQGHIQIIDLTANHLVGDLPNELFDLPYLESLVLADNADLTISLSQLGRAQFLKTLDISNTNVDSLNGVGQGTSLEILDFSGLGLSGPIPSELFTMTTLRSLVASDNELTGPLPSEIANLFYLEDLSFYENELTGAIPSSIGFLSNLRTLTLSQNPWSGMLPEMLSRCSDLVLLAIHREYGNEKGPGISGPLPALDGLTQIAQVHFQNQQLTGAIPSSFLQSASDDDVVSVDLMGNKITGPIPANLSEKTRLQLYLADNEIDNVSDNFCASAPGWNGGDVGSFGCPGLLCPSGFFAAAGRQVDATLPCTSCDSATNWGSTTCDGANGTPSNEQAILVDFYNAMNGRYWKNSAGWLDASVAMCEWFGISCDSSGSITGINLRNNDLTNSVPSSLFSLPQLRIVDLSANSITNFDFSIVGSAALLQVLDLTQADLDSLDGIESLSQTSIRQLSIASNYLQGELPSAVFTLTTLEELDISHNRFSGSLSGNIGQLTSLVRFRFFGNGFSGALPSELGSLANLVELLGAENSFSGELPSSFDLLSNLESMSLHQTTSASAISGSLPSFRNLQQLRSLQLDGNALSGTLPEDLLQNTRRGSDRVEIMLGDNRLGGTIPASWASRFSQLVVDLSDNRISGIGNGLCDEAQWMDGAVGSFQCDAILCPSGTFANLGRKTTSAVECESCPTANFLGATNCNGQAAGGGEAVNVLQSLFDSTHGDMWTNSAGWGSNDDFCSWYGVACNAANEIVKISLEENGLTGIPDSTIFEISTLRELNLAGNLISFSFAGIGRAASLEVLVLSGTNLDSVDGVGEASGLLELHLTDNDLGGTFPDELLRLTSLQTLLLNFNNIEGRLPPEISALQNLEELFMYHNRLEGQIPAALGTLAKLRVLALSENNFSGSLPAELNELVDLEVLAIQREGGTDSSDGANVGVNQGGSKDGGGGLGGPLLAFDRLSRLQKLYLGVNSLTGTIPSNFLDGIADKTGSLEVDLVSNRLTGGVPASLARFERLTLYAADNEISAIPSGVCQQSSWMKGQVSSFLCDAILCPPGSASQYGRQADSSSVCTTCPQGTNAPFFGAFQCKDASEEQADDERSILEELYTTTNGASWIYDDKWMDSDESICSWHGITCAGATESVESIHLMENGLVGTLPVSVYTLPNLKEINFGGNEILISFSGIQQAQNLEYVNLEYVGLQSLAGLERVTGLKLLYVAGNNFQGVLPSEILQLVNLEVLNLSRNDIGPTLPSTIASLGNLVSFWCDRCGLTGSIGGAIGSLANLEYLRLSKNAFTGIIPAEINALVNLKTLDLSDQISDGETGGLEGTVPPFDGFLQLDEVHLARNRLTGDIPSTFLQDTDASKRVTVDLSRNNITGGIPVSLGRFADLIINVADNAITAISPELCSLSWNGVDAADGSCDHILCDIDHFNGIGRATNNLPCEECSVASNTPYFGATSCGEDFEREILFQLYRELGGHDWDHSDGWNSNAHHCSWYGVTCYQTPLRLNLVRKLELGDNNLVGTVSSRIWLLTEMEELDLSQNGIDASFNILGDAQTLKVLKLSNTNVRILDGIGVANSLEDLHLTGNDISGPFPPGIFNLLQLERLFMNHNRLTGPLPSDIINLWSLKELYIFDNELSGELPAAFGFQIRVLSLGMNNFSGTIPRNYGNFPFMEILSLEREEHKSDDLFSLPEPRLTGTLLSFARASQLRELYLTGNALGGSIPSDFLANVQNKSITVHVDLSHNSIFGSIPPTLTAFADLRLYVADNAITDVPGEICDSHQWMDGLMASGCDALLCPPGTFNQYGRRIESESCEPCDYRGAAVFYGSDYCGPQLPLSESEEEKLSEFFLSTGGDSWTDNTNWNTGASVCDWRGVDCEAGGNGAQTVVSLSLPANNLIGTVPSIVFYLPNLRSLDLSGNAIDIVFRDAHKATNLEELLIADTIVTSLEGVSQLPRLRILKTSRTFFGKSLPEELFTLTLLEQLDISQSSFFGTLPSSIGDLSNLQNFIATNNDLGGTIPTSIGRLIGLNNLLLSENNFFGSLPTELGALVSLEALSLDKRTRTTAGLSGPLLAFENASKLRQLDLGGNSLTGTLPSGLLSNLDDFNDPVGVFLDGNLLTGEIPADYTRFVQLNLDVTMNEITSIGEGLCAMANWWQGDVGLYDCDALLCAPGFYSALGRQSSTTANRCEPCEGLQDPEGLFFGRSVCPSELKAQSKLILQRFYEATAGPSWSRRDNWMNNAVDICDWFGVTCRSDFEIESIILGANNLAGTIPSEIYQLNGLEFLWIFSNPITLSFAGIENASNLKSLQLDSTGLTSLDGIGRATALVDVDVRFNSLSGPLTSEIDSLTELETFFVGDNGLSGSLPDFHANRKLTQLRLGSNSFTGTLPAFDAHPNLKTIDVSDNILQGEIPGNILQLVASNTPVFLDFSANQFSGILPAALSRFPTLTVYVRDNRIDGIHPTLCEELLWNGGDVGAFGCDGILCPPGTYSSTGRASQESAQCLSCPGSNYYGPTTCSGDGGGATKVSDAYSHHGSAFLASALLLLSGWFLQ